MSRRALPRLWLTWHRAGLGKRGRRALLVGSSILALVLSLTLALVSAQQAWVNPQAVPGAQASAPAGKVHAIAGEPGDPARLHAASEAGLQGSQDGGASWQAIPIGGASDEVFGVAVGPGVVLAGRRDGLWRSQDGGRSWALMPPPSEGPSIPLALGIAPSRPDVIYMATARDGVWRSDDGGYRWTAADAGLPRVADRVVEIRALVVHPGDPDVAYVAHETWGVYVTGDGGRQWRPLNDGLVRIGASVPPPRIAFEPGDGGRLLLVLPQRIHSRLLKSRLYVLARGGAEWQAPPVALPGNTRVLALVPDASRGVMRMWTGEGAWDLAIPPP